MIGFARYVLRALGHTAKDTFDSLDSEQFRSKKRWALFGLANLAAAGAIAGAGFALKDSQVLRDLEHRVNPTIAARRDAAEQRAKAPEHEKYLLKDYPQYNALLPVMEQESQRSGLPLELLALIALTESTGKGGPRYEQAFQHKYVEPQFDSNKTNIFKELYAQLNKKDPSLTEEKFKEQLATSTGPLQVMYLTAVEHGFRGTIEELSEPATNAHWAAAYLQDKGVTKDTPLETALTIYNTGSPNGKPRKGHIERALAYREMFSEEYRKLFPVK